MTSKQFFVRLAWRIFFVANTALTFFVARFVIEQFREAAYSPTGAALGGIVAAMFVMIEGPLIAAEIVWSIQRRSGRAHPERLQRPGDAGERPAGVLEPLALDVVGRR